MLQQNATQIAGLEKERDFYYQKLRDVEVICQEPECESLTSVQKILEILYATEVCRENEKSRRNFLLISMAIFFLKGRF